MSEAVTEAPRLRIVRTMLSYLALWPLIAGIAAMVGAAFAGSPLNAADFLTNPREMFGFFMLFYVLGAVPAALNGMIVAILSPSPARPWMLPAVSGLLGALLLGLTGYLSMKSLDSFFPILGVIAGLTLGLIVLWKRRWFERS